MKRMKKTELFMLALSGFSAVSTSMAETNVLSLHQAVELDYPMTNGAIYQLQATDNLLGPWSNSGPAVFGEECSETFLQSTRYTTHKFWRVIEGNASNALDFSQARSLSSANRILFENVLWQGTNWMAYYRVGNTLHAGRMAPLATFQIPNATITIDGDPVEWSSVPAVYTDPQHDQNPPDNHSGTDVMQYKIARDETNIYMAYWLYDGNPPIDGTMYWTEFQQYLNQMHTPGDTMVMASYSEGAGQWQVSIGHREHQGEGITYGPDHVGAGSKFIEYKIPIADVEYDGGGAFGKTGIETRFLRAYVHYVHGDTPDDPLNTYDGVGEDEKVMIVRFY